MTRVSVPAPSDLGAHGDQAIGQIDHFRLARGVFDHGRPSASVAAISTFSVAGDA
jgi:hypothetical protein